MNHLSWLISNVTDFYDCTLFKKQYSDINNGADILIDPKLKK